MTEALFKQVDVFYGVEWPIEDSVYRDQQQDLKKNPHANEDSTVKKVKLADILRSNASAPAEGQLLVRSDEFFVIASPPRQYRYLGFQYGKSDIVVVGRPDQAEECKSKFEEEKERALLDKARLDDYLKKAMPLLKRLFEEGIIEGVIGRGSYFEDNGFPSPEDDVDLVLMRLKDLNDEEQSKLESILMQEKSFPILFIPLQGGQEKTINGIKTGKPISLIFTSKSIVESQPGIEYDRHVLQHGIGIDVEGLPKEKSEKLAKEFLSLLPKHNRSKSY